MWYSKTPGRNATGYLQHRIGNVRRRLSGDTEKPVGSTLKQNLTPAVNFESSDGETSLTDDQYIFRKTWLKDFREPASQVKQFLDETFHRRRMEIMDKSKDLSFTTEWPALFYSPECVSITEFDLWMHFLEFWHERGITPILFCYINFNSNYFLLD